MIRGDISGGSWHRRATSTQSSLSTVGGSLYPLAGSSFGCRGMSVGSMSGGRYPPHSRESKEIAHLRSHQIHQEHLHEEQPAKQAQWGRLSSASCTLAIKSIKVVCGGPGCGDAAREGQVTLGKGTETLSNYQATSHTQRAHQRRRTTILPRRGL